MAAPASAPTSSARPMPIPMLRLVSSLFVCLLLPLDEDPAPLTAGEETVVDAALFAGLAAEVGLVAGLVVVAAAVGLVAGLVVVVVVEPAVGLVAGLVVVAAAVGLVAGLVVVVVVEPAVGLVAGLVVVAAAVGLVAGLVVVVVVEPAAGPAVSLAVVVEAAVESLAGHGVIGAG
jgi:hypothetical protein